MMMRRTAAGIVAGAAFLTGCSAAETMGNHPQSYETGPYLTGEAGEVVDLNSLPATLPAAVAAQTPNAVAVSRREDTQVYVASGVRLATDLYLTAGHFTHDTVGNASVATDAPGVDVCGALTADAETAGAASATTPAQATSTVTRRVESFDSSGASDIPDAQLFQAAPAANQVPYVPSRISSQSLAIGQVLFGINYAPSGKDQAPRGPAQRNPAIIGMVVVGFADNGQAYAVDGLRGYGADKDNKLSPGGSGGGAFLPDGELAATTADIVGSEAVQEVEANNGITLKGVAPSESLDVVEVQPVSSAVDDLENKLKTAPLCKPAK